MTSIADALGYDRYEIRRQFFRIFGGAFRIYNPMGQLVFFAEQKAFRLREDIRLYTDESMSTEALLIKARRILDWSAAYDVLEPVTERKLGAFRRRGFASLVRDEWLVLDPEDREIGRIREDSLLLGLIRRFLTTLIPQSFEVEMDGAPVATFKQNFNPFVLKLTVDFSQDATRALDRRLGLAAGVLMCAIEGRQSGE